MRRVWWHLMGRFYEARSIRALIRHDRFRRASEKFFRRLDRGAQE